MTQFSLSGAQLPHVADLLAAGAGKAMGSVDDLGQALNQAGLLASSTGHVHRGDDRHAGRVRLGRPDRLRRGHVVQDDAAAAPGAVAAVRCADEELGINAYDAQGNFVGLADLAQQLQDHLGG
jgi:hypothetical protein